MFITANWIFSRILQLQPPAAQCKASRLALAASAWIWERRQARLIAKMGHGGAWVPYGALWCPQPSRCCLGCLGCLGWLGLFSVDELN